MRKNKKKEIKFSGKMLVNGTGKEVAIELIRPEVLKRDKIVKKMYNRLRLLYSKMLSEKQKILTEIGKYQKAMANETGTEVLENATLSDYSNTIRIVKRNNRVIDFDDNIQLAEKKIKELIRKWGENSNPYIAEIVDRTFKTDRKGFINKNSILSLFTININDPDWLEAMELIRKSMYENAQKEYIMVQYRNDHTAGWETLNLNFSSISEE